MSFLKGNNEKFLSSKFETYKTFSKDDLNSSHHIVRNVKCNFLLSEDVSFETNYDFEHNIFRNSRVKFKVDGDYKVILLNKEISLPFDSLPQIIKFQSLFVVTK